MVKGGVFFLSLFLCGCSSNRLQTSNDTDADGGILTQSPYSTGTLDDFSGAATTQELTQYITNSDLSCVAEQTLTFNGTTWNCAYPTTHNLATATIDVNRLTPGSENQIPVSNGGSVSWQDVNPKLPPRFIDGLIASYVDSDSILVSAGQAKSDNHLTDIVLPTDTSVTIQYNLSDGSNCPDSINCLQSGSRENNKWYAIWLVKGASGVGFVLTSEDLVLNAPAGYTDAKKRIGWIQTDGAGNIKQFVARAGYDNSRVYSCDQSISFNVNSTLTSNLIDVSTLIPPNIKWANLWVYVSMDNSSADAERRVTVGNGSILGAEAWEVVIWGGSTSANIPSMSLNYETELYTTGPGTARRVNAWQTGSPLPLV